MREIELLKESRDLLEEVDKLISQMGSFEMDKTEFDIDEKRQLLIVTVNNSETDVFTYKNAYEFLYIYKAYGNFRAIIFDNKKCHITYNIWHFLL